MMPKDRRVCLVIVPERLLVNLFQGPGQCIAVRLNHPKLPPDAEVVGVRHDWDRQALSALVHSESFQKVTDGAPLPYFDCGGTVADYTLRYIDGDRITERRPLAQQRREAEAEFEFAKMGGRLSLQDVARRFSLPAELVNGSNNLPATVHLKNESGDVVGSADIDSAGQATLNVNESSREWFQRIMSQTD